MEEIDRRMGLYSVPGTSEGESLGYIDADGCPASTSVATMVVGATKAEEDLRASVAYGRNFGFVRLKMVSADLLIVEKAFWRARRETFDDMTSPDGRVFGMVLKKADKLPLKAKFLIMDNPIAEGTGVAAAIGTSKEVHQDTKTLIETMKYLKKKLEEKNANT